MEPAVADAESNAVNSSTTHAHAHAGVAVIQFDRSDGKQRTTSHRCSNVTARHPIAGSASRVAMLGWMHQQQRGECRRETKSGAKIVGKKASNLQNSESSASLRTIEARKLRL